MEEFVGEVWEMRDMVFSRGEREDPDTLTLVVVGRNEVEPSVRCLVVVATNTWSSHREGKIESWYAGWFFGTHPMAKRLV